MGGEKHRAKAVAATGRKVSVTFALRNSGAPTSIDIGAKETSLNKNWHVFPERDVLTGQITTGPELPQPRWRRTLQ